MRFIKGHNPLNEITAIEVLCSQCGKKIYREIGRVKKAKNSFCSRECSDKWKSVHSRGENNPGWCGGFKTINCDQCGKSIFIAPYRIKQSKHSFCCQKCRGIWLGINKSGENSSGWRGGISDKGYCVLWRDKEFKEYIFERDRYECQNPMCLKKSDHLVRHHIDYDKKNCNPDNIITVCNSCNSAANANRDWHKGYYQAIMSKRFNSERRINNEY